MAERIWRKYYVPGGKSPSASYKTLPLPTADSSREFKELCIVANYVEVSLAREGHTHPVGINYLEKIQLPHLPSLYGAMLAGVAYVLMGAGIPFKVPGVMDRLAQHEPTIYPLSVTGAGPGAGAYTTFTPADFTGQLLPPLPRPAFLAIVSSDTLALTLARKSNGHVNGFVVEGPSAGGHNAPPRGKLQLNDLGEPVYGERDRVDLDKLLALGLPVWLAGGYGSPERLREAMASGACGIQVGTAFALCKESGLREDYRRTLLAAVAAGTAHVFTDPRASPTGFPFKVAAIPGSLSDESVFQARPRICDLGYLREAYLTREGSVDFRCPAEPMSLFVAKGGDANAALGRKCICNALMANIGHAQIRPGRLVENGLVTTGDDLAGIGRFFASGADDYTAADVVSVLLSGANPSGPVA